MSAILMKLTMGLLQYFHFEA